jgi:hypothetical protein
MSDPTGNGIGKASQQMVQELQKQMQQTDHKQGAQSTQFSEVLNAQDPSKVNDPAKAADVLRTAQMNQVNGTDEARLGVKPVEAKEKAAGAGLKGLLNQVVDGQNKLDDIIKLATSGKSYGNQELLAIQAAVYKFSQELDLTSKVVEKATSGVKQTMQTQV